MEDWDIEEFRTKFESDEHWILKRDFMIAHKDKFSKDRVVCLAQLFVNIELLRCKYPDPVMRQIAELSRGIGKDYKTKQKERLQRTFVKASDAASAKVRGVKRKYSPEQQGSPSKISCVQETPSGSSTGVGIERTNSGSSSVASKITFLRETGETTTEKPDVLSDPSFSQANKYTSSLKRDIQIEGESDMSSKTTEVKNADENLEVKTKKSDPSLDVNFNDPYASNLFVVYRSFTDFTSYFNFLKRCIDFSHFMLRENFHQEEATEKWICTLTVKVKDDTLSLGSGENSNRKAAREEASKQAVHMLLQKCYAMEIKKQVVGNEEITLNKLDSISERGKKISSEENKISSDNVGAKLLKLMGWSGGGLGKTGEGITEPVQAAKVFGRKGLGIGNEQNSTPNFRKKVQSILDSMLASLQNQPNSVVLDTVFSCELSGEQRNCIDLLVRQRYHPKLKAFCYGKREDRYLVVKPRMKSGNLFRKVSLQGGLTDQYQIHKPGILTLDSIKIKN